MNAKFAGNCCACGGPIGKGESCDYERGKGIRHYNCPEKDESAEQMADRLGFRDYSAELAAIRNDQGGRLQENGGLPPAAAKDLTA